MQNLNLSLLWGICYYLWLPCSKSFYTSEALSVINIFDFLSSPQLLLIDPLIGHKFPLTVGFRTPNARLTQYVITYVLVPRKFNFGRVSKVDVAITWLLANKTETNWATGILQYMLGYWEMEVHGYHMVIWLQKFYHIFNSL